MKSLTTKKRTPQTTPSFEEIIILPFANVEEDTDQLLKEMLEEEQLAKENGANYMMAEIERLNDIRFGAFSRVA
jgi:hypothetical protein